MLLKFSTLIGLVATLASVHVSEATEYGVSGMSFQNFLIIKPVYQTKNPSDTFAQACASNTVQLAIETSLPSKKSVGLCDIDLTKLNIEQYCPLTGPDFFGLGPCGNAVVAVKGDPEVVATRGFTVTIEADFSTPISPPIVSRCSPLRIVGENNAAGGGGGSRRLRKRVDYQAKYTTIPFQCPSA